MWINPLQRSHFLCKPSPLCGRFFEEFNEQARKMLLLTCLVAPPVCTDEELLHVSFTALDFLIEKSPGRTVRGPQVACGRDPNGPRATKAKRLMCFCTIASASSIRLDIFNFLFPGRSGTCPIWLEIQSAPDRRGYQPLSPASHLPLRPQSCIFFAILIAIHFGRFDNVDLQSAQRVRIRSSSSASVTPSATPVRSSNVR